MNKEHLIATYDIYNLIRPKIEGRISDFKKIWEQGDYNQIFMELAFCILTPQSRARSAEKCINRLLEKNMFFKASQQEIEDNLVGIRFSKNKASYLLKAREEFIDNRVYDLKIKMIELGTNFSRREWIVEKVKGIGYKEGSHFLRNTGFCEDIAILDRHILKNLKNLNVIDSIPSTLSKSKYYDIESKMKDFAYEINIPLAHLDFVWWYKETSDIFK